MGRLSGIEGKGAKVGSKNTTQMGRRTFTVQRKVTKR